MMRRTLAAAVAVLFVSAPARAQAPLTPGAVALLVNSQQPDASGTLRRALSDTNPDVRRTAARVVSVSRPDVFEALRSALASEHDPAVITEFVKDIMALGGADAAPLVESQARNAGADAIAEIAEWFARMDAGGFASRLAGWAEAPRIEARLTAAVQLAMKCHPDARQAILAAWQPVASAAAYRSAAKQEKTVERKGSKGGKTESAALLQTPLGLPAQIMRATLADAGCVTRGVIYGAMVNYRPDGRPESVEVAKQLAPPCYAAVTAIARLSNAYFTDPAGQQREVLVPMSDDVLTCAEASTQGLFVFLAKQNEGVQSPRLTREVKPNYSSAGMQQKLEGVVEMEGVVSTDGCVAALRVSRSLGVLDVQAMRAVLQWHFDPGRFADHAIPTLVNIELTFTLK